MAEEKIMELIEEGAGQKLELRKDLAVKEREIMSLARSMTAFANTNDGTIVIGVDESTKDVIGLDIESNSIEGIMKIGSDYCNPAIIPEVRIEKIGLKNVVTISIKRGNKSPYHTDGVCYIRKGRDVHVASHSDIEGMYLEKKELEESKGDDWPVKGATYESLDPKKIDEYIEKRKKRLGEEVNIPKEKFLELMGVLIEGEGRFIPTAGGMLVFGRHPQHFLWGSNARAVRFKGNDVGGVIIDQKEVNGTIQEMIDGIRQFIVKHMRLGGKIEDLMRREVPEYPELIIREAVTNAIIHRDYTISGATVRIFMFDNRIEIYTPGGLPGPVTVENIEDTQYSRNRVIVELLLQMGYMEKLGIGIKRIKLAARENGLTEPKLLDTGTDFVLTLFGSGDRVVQIEKHERVKNVQKMLAAPKKPIDIERPEKEVEKEEKEISRGDKAADRKIGAKTKMIAAGISLTFLIVLIGVLYKTGDNDIRQYRLAANLHAEKQYEKALIQYRDFIRRFPNSKKIGDAQYYLASCLEMIGKDKEALNAYRDLLDNYPASDKTSYAQYSIGTIYLKQGLVNKAMEELQKEIRDYPRSPITLSALRDLALSHQRQNYFEEAIKRYQEALDFQGRISNGYECYQMALCYLQLKQFKEAKKMFEEVILNPASDMEWIRKAKTEMDGLKKIQEEEERAGIKGNLIKDSVPPAGIKEEKTSPASGHNQGIDGLVSYVNLENNFVIVNLGATDGMKNEMILDIFKQDNSEEKTGEIKVLTAGETSSMAEIISKTGEIIKGSKVKLR